MIVLDVSSILELLLGTQQGGRVRELIADLDVSLHVPHLLDVEVIQALRRYLRMGEIDPEEAEDAIANLRGLDLERHAHEPLLDRVWALRDNVTAYDAVYVALAEALGAKLFTCDAKLARVPGLQQTIALIVDAGASSMS